MGYSKTQKILFALLCLFIILFPFWCVRGLCAENTEIEGTIINGFSLEDYQVNGVLQSGSSGIIYFPVEVGKTYNITFGDNQISPNRYIFQSSSIPAVGVSYNFVADLYAGSSLTYVANEPYLAIFTLSSYPEVLELVKVYELSNGMYDTVTSLVDNVGINSIWNIFNISIDYIIIVVLFAFGVYIIFRIVRAISKGKEGL